MFFISRLKRECAVKYRKRKWRFRNKHNMTTLDRDCPVDLITVGNYTYGALNVNYANEFNHLYIGSFCSIAEGVYFVLSSEHRMNTLSTYPYKSLVMNAGLEGLSKGDIIVDDDVWIGYGATIMSGVHIGQGAVIAAGAVVTKDVPPYAVVGGVPAKVIKYRFSQGLIDDLLKVDYSKLTDNMIKEHIDDLYTELTDIKRHDWLPKKSE